VNHGRKRWCQIGSLCRFFCEPQDPLFHRLNFLCSRRCTAETYPAARAVTCRATMPGRSPCAPLSLAQGVDLPPFPPAATHANRPTTAAGRMLLLHTCGCASSIVPRPSPSLHRATLAPSASARAMVCSHLAISKSSTSSS
jgi:hypothetical protein